MLYKKLIGIGIALLIILAWGTSGYVVLERWTPFEAFYMTVITLSSVGFMEVRPLSGTGRMFTVLLILCGSGVLIYGISIVTAFIVEGELTDVLRRRKMNKNIDRLKDHYIVCGAGQTGRYVIGELEKTKKNFVVIEKNADKIQQFMARNILCIEGDATHEAVLLRGGIKKAKGFITSLHSDAENILVVITAKRLNPNLRVISKAFEEESEQKIRMVGADGVVMPNFIGGLRMVSEMIRPSVVNFLDIMLRARDKTTRVEELELTEDSPLIGKTLEEAGMCYCEGAALVALKEKGTADSYLFNPSRQTVLTANSVIILMGDVDRIKEISDRANPEKAG